MEVSSHALALGRVDTLTFDYAIFSNLTDDHLDFHKTFEHYVDSKKKLFTIVIIHPFTQKSRAFIRNNV